MVHTQNKSTAHKDFRFSPCPSLYPSLWPPGHPDPLLHHPHSVSPTPGSSWPQRLFLSRKFSLGHSSRRHPLSFIPRFSAVLSPLCFLTRLCSPATLEHHILFSSSSKHLSLHHILHGLPSQPSGKESTCQFRSHRRWDLNLWVGKIPWRMKWQPTAVFLLGHSLGQRSLLGYSPWGHEELGMTEHTAHTHTAQSSLCF